MKNRRDMKIKTEKMSFLFLCNRLTKKCHDYFLETMEAQ